MQDKLVQLSLRSFYEIREKQKKHFILLAEFIKGGVEIPASMSHTRTHKTENGHLYNLYNPGSLINKTPHLYLPALHL